MKDNNLPPPGSVVVWFTVTRSVLQLSGMNVLCFNDQFWIPVAPITLAVAEVLLADNNWLISLAGPDCCAIVKT